MDIIACVSVTSVSVARAGESCYSHGQYTWCRGYCCDGDDDCCGEWVPLLVGLSIGGFLIVLGIIVLAICCYNNYKKKGHRGNIINPGQGPVVYSTHMNVLPPAYPGGPQPGYTGGPQPGYTGGPQPGYMGGPQPGYTGGPQPGSTGEPQQGQSQPAFPPPAYQYQSESNTLATDQKSTS